MTIKPAKSGSLAKKVIIKKHIHGPLKGKISKWYWACTVCELVYFTKGPANFCCADIKRRHWVKLWMRPMQDAIGRLVDGEFTRFKKGVK